VYTEKVWQAVSSMHEIETGNFSPPRLVLIPADSIRVVNWNIKRGLFEHAMVGLTRIFPTFAVTDNHVRTNLTL
jgi:hypothetical protein